MKEKQKLVFWLCGKSRHLVNRCPQGKASKKTGGKAFEAKARQNIEKVESSRTHIALHCNKCGSHMHDTNSCPQSPFHVKREQVHLMNENCCDSNP